MKEIVEKINAEYQRSYWAYEKLERATFDSDYKENFDDTVNRLYEQGYSEALAMVQRLLESLCVICYKNADNALYGYCNACYYGTTKETN